MLAIALLLGIVVGVLVPLKFAREEALKMGFDYDAGLLLQSVDHIRGYRNLDSETYRKVLLCELQSYAAQMVVSSD
jgi:hypothetical protein